MMRLASLFPKTLWPAGGSETQKAGRFYKHVTNGLLALSRRACTHPIHTIVVVFLIASTSYVRLLDSSLFQDVGRPIHDPRDVNVDSLLQGSRSLRLGDGTSWRWQSVVGKESVDKVRTPY